MLCAVLATLAMIAHFGLPRDYCHLILADGHGGPPHIENSAE
jgi:hypothetical protein